MHARATERLMSSDEYQKAKDGVNRFLTDYRQHRSRRSIKNELSGASSSSVGISELRHEVERQLASKDIHVDDATISEHIAELRNLLNIQSSGELRQSVGGSGLNVKRTCRV